MKTDDEDVVKVAEPPPGPAAGPAAATRTPLAQRVLILAEVIDLFIGH